MDHVEALQSALPAFLRTAALPDERQQTALRLVLAAAARGHTAVQHQGGASEFVRSQQGYCALAAFAAAEEAIAAGMQQRYEASLAGPEQALLGSPIDGLSQEQRDAALRALNAKIFLLEGGPGTGKTFTAAWLLKQLGDMRWLALAPTGKAKAQLESSLSRYGMRSDWTMTVQAALARHTRDEGILDAEVVLIDESSMLDSMLFYRLIKALKPTARLLLLGDRHQLPPVGPGQPFADFCQAWQGSSLHCRLDQSKRTESADLLHIAQAVQDRRVEDLPLRTLGSRQQMAASILEFHQRILPEDLDQLAAALNERMVLGALQEGPWGVEVLQKDLAEQSVDPSHSLRPTPLMITSNVERADLWNGDLGWLCRPVGAAPFVLMNRRSSRENASTEQGPLRRIPLASLPSWEYAWMLTVHKAQGSEFQKVAVLLPPGAERFGTQLLYTAVTRARRDLEIWSWPWVIDQVLSHGTLRQTWLQRLLQKPHQTESEPTPQPQPSG